MTLKIQPDEPLLDVRQAALRLGVKESTIRSWVATRKIGFTKIGRCVRFKLSTIQAIIEENFKSALWLGVEADR